VGGCGKTAILFLARKSHTGIMVETSILWIPLLMLFWCVFSHRHDKVSV
jgi:hypothetical protein